MPKKKNKIPKQPILPPIHTNIDKQPQPIQQKPIQQTKLSEEVDKLLESIKHKTIDSINTNITKQTTEQQIITMANIITNQTILLDSLIKVLILRNTVTGMEIDLMRTINTLNLEQAIDKLLKNNTKDNHNPKDNNNV